MRSLPLKALLYILTRIATTSAAVTAFIPHQVRPQLRHYSNEYTKLFDMKRRDSFDMEELRQRIRAEQIKPVSDILHQFQEAMMKNIRKNSASSQQLQQLQQPLNTVYIVSFQKHGNKSNMMHGVHAIEYPKGSGNNVVLAFTNEESCNKFAQSLRSQRFFHATTQKMSIEALVDFCLGVGVMMQLIPDGIDIIPPKQNVSKLGLQQRDETRRQKQIYHELNVAYYMLDETDDFDEEGILVEHTLNGNKDAASAVGAFE